MEKYSVREVVDQAVQTEKLGHDFYTRMAKKFSNNELKGLFNTLALLELEHEKKFLELRENASAIMIENPEEVSKYMRAIAESEFFLGRNKSLPALEHLESMEDAVRFALGFERETLLYYYGLKDILGEDEILNEIITEEKSHIIWLSKFRKQCLDKN